MINSKTQAKHWAEKDLKIIQSYWDSPPATKRSVWFAEQLKSIDGFESICEIGFFSGRNLRYVSEAMPDKKIHGIEINSRAVDFASKKLPDADLRCMDLHDFNDQPDSFDIVFTSGVLIHIPPDDIKSVVSKLSGAASKYVMHIETLGKNTVSAGPKNLKPTYKVSDQIQWAPDLMEAYLCLGFDKKDISVVSLPEDCRTNGASELMIVNLKNRRKK